MASLGIKSHARYAVRDHVSVHKANGVCVAGLLIELSTQGCRISNLGNATFAHEEPVIVIMDGRELSGRVRWSHDGIAGIRLEIPLIARQLADLVAWARPEPPLRYGT